MQATEPQEPDPLVVRAAVLTTLKEGQGSRIRASELHRLAAPQLTSFEKFLALLETMDEEDLIEVDWKADAEGVARDRDPACWID